MHPHCWPSFVVGAVALSPFLVMFGAMMGGATARRRNRTDDDD